MKLGAPFSYKGMFGIIEFPFCFIKVVCFHDAHHASFLMGIGYSFPVSTPALCFSSTDRARGLDFGESVQF